MLPAPVVIFAHGLGSVRRGEKSLALETECAQRNWAFAACDFRGHGESDGTMTDLCGSRLLEDLHLTVRHVAEKTGGEVFLVGSSMGGWTTAWFAARHPQRVSACAFIAPSFQFTEWKRLTATQRDEWFRTKQLHIQNLFIDVILGEQMLQELGDFRMDALLERYRTPALIFHGMQDDVVPYQISLKFAQQCRINDIELMLLRDGDHRLNFHRERIAHQACEFFARQLTD